jgi:hypothetical protein
LKNTKPGRNRKPSTKKKARNSPVSSPKLKGKFRPVIHEAHIWPKEKPQKPKGKPPKNLLPKIAKAKKFKKYAKKKGWHYKSGQWLKLKKLLIDRSYDEEEIDRIHDFTTSGRDWQIALSISYLKLESARRRNRTRKKDRPVSDEIDYLVDGKWISYNTFKKRVKMLAYWQIVKQYQALYGMSLSEAREYYVLLRGKNALWIRQALY